MERWLVQSEWHGLWCDDMSRHFMMSWRHMTLHYDIKWHQITNFGAKGLANVWRGRCMNAQTFSFSIILFQPQMSHSVMLLSSCNAHWLSSSISWVEQISRPCVRAARCVPVMSIGHRSLELPSIMLMNGDFSWVMGFQTSRCTTIFR